MGVDVEHPPAVAVADLVDLLASAVVCAGFNGHGGVVVAAQNQIARADLLITSYPHARGVGVGEVVVEAPVDGVGDVPSVAEDRDVFALRVGGDVGGGGVGGHRDRVPGVQAVVGAVPADGFA